MHEYLVVEQSPCLVGTASLEGAKNAVLVIMASLILTSGKSKLTNVPASRDVYMMISLLQELGAVITFDESEGILQVDTSDLCGWQVSANVMKQMRASVLVMGPLLARYGKAQIAFPGGCSLGARPIDLHLKAFARMGVTIDFEGECLCAQAASMKPVRYIFDYPSVGATENVIMAAARIKGVTEIVNAALEPEVFDLVEVLRKMGANISYEVPGIIRVEGVDELKPIEHAIMHDRLEAGTLLLAVAIAGGQLYLPEAPASSMELFLEKLHEMGHQVTVGQEGRGVQLKATASPRAVSFKTMPYPGFPTDLQSPMMAALCLADGVSVIHETVFENRMMHVRELQKMGAHIELTGDVARVKGVDRLHGMPVAATDIRAGAAMIIAGLAAQGVTTISGVHHLQRGYQGIEKKLTGLGAHIRYATIAQIKT